MTSTLCSRAIPNQAATQLVPTRPHHPPLSRRSPATCIKTCLRPFNTYRHSHRGSRKLQILNAPQHPAPSSNPHRDRRTGPASHPAISCLGASQTPGNSSAQPHTPCNGVRETCTRTDSSEPSVRSNSMQQFLTVGRAMIMRHTGRSSTSTELVGILRCGNIEGAQGNTWSELCHLLILSTV